MRGLQSANLAALATRLTSDHRRMLRRVRGGEDVRSSARDEDRIRQLLRREGLIKYAGTPKRWKITDAGIAILAREALISHC